MILRGKTEDSLHIIPVFKHDIEYDLQAFTLGRGMVVLFHIVVREISYNDASATAASVQTLIVFSVVFAFDTADSKRADSAVIDPTVHI
jgi:hypothetical protein